MKSNIRPCVDCITLAMCISFMSDHYGFSSLEDRCSIFKDRYENKVYSPDHPEVLFLLKLFKPQNYKQRIRIAETIRDAKESYEHFNLSM